MEKEKIEGKLTPKEIASGIKSRSRETVIPKNQIIDSKKQKEKKDRKSWRKDLQDIVNS